ncbi:MAG: leucyl aminopeptidase [Pseudomonadota bacterium]
MATPAAMTFVETDLDQIVEHEGLVVVVIPENGRLDQGARRVNKLTRGALTRYLESSEFEKQKPGSVKRMSYPAGMAAKAVIALKLERNAKPDVARKAGIALGRMLDTDGALVLAGSTRAVDEIALGAALRAYEFNDHKTAETSKGAGAITVMSSKTQEVDSEALSARAAGVFFTRDLTNEPANVLTTSEFARRLEDLSALGLKIEVLEEAEMEKLGMGALLGVGQGSDSPSKIVIMHWEGAEGDPLALIGKGVVFDTGGISLKPAGGMEDMTMDMGGAGVVSGVMKTLAMRKAKANVVGLVGLVENMPDARAQRPGDVVTSMKGDTIEVINTDAEGRLVLADVMWYAQDRFKPTGMIDLATLTGAVIIGLGHENAGVFSNNDDFVGAFLDAAKSEGDGAWRMPLGAGYDKQLTSRVADMKNVGGRPAGSITAAQFLQRFVKDDTPWIHLDIAGVASLKSEGPMSPKGATGWGVLALDRMVADKYED